LKCMGEGRSSSKAGSTQFEGGKALTCKNEHTKVYGQQKGRGVSDFPSQLRGIEKKLEHSAPGKARRSQAIVGLSVRKEGTPGKPSKGGNQTPESKKAGNGYFIEGVDTKMVRKSGKMGNT